MPSARPTNPVLLRTHRLVAGRRLVFCVPFAEGGGVFARDVVLEREFLAPSTAGATWVDAGFGPVLRFQTNQPNVHAWNTISVGASGGQDVLLPSWYAAPPTADWTIEFYAALVDTATYGINVSIDKIGAYRICRNSVDGAMRFQNPSDTNNISSTESSHEVGRWRMFHAVKSGDTVKLYRDGGLVASGTGFGSSAWSWASGDVAGVAVGGAFGWNNHADLGIFSFWAEALSSLDVVERAGDPWGILAEGGGGGGGDPVPPNPRSTTIFGQIPFRGYDPAPLEDLVEERDGGTNAQRITATYPLVVTPDTDEPSEEKNFSLDSAFVADALDDTPAAHTHPQSDVVGLVGDLALKAPLASPALTGNPTAPTQAPLDSSTKLATTEYVDDAIAAAPAVGRYRSLSYTSDGTDLDFLVDGDGSAVYTLEDLE